MQRPQALGLRILQARRLFQQIDVDHSGFISLSALQAAVQVVQLSEIVRAQIEFGEFESNAPLKLQVLHLHACLQACAICREATNSEIVRNLLNSESSSQEIQNQTATEAVLDFFESRLHSMVLVQDLKLR